MIIASAEGRCQPSRYRTLAKVTFRLFDTAYRAVREFRPVTQGKVSVYRCGATVQGVPPLGHLRSADSIRDSLKASGLVIEDTPTGKRAGDDERTEQQMRSPFLMLPECHAYVSGQEGSSH
jgi:hypothetical protein